MLYLGAAWYPEHWPEARWAEDIRMMKEANLTVARLAEFAWSALEPSEGCHNLDWLVKACEMLHANGFAIVIGTPTATPPAWLTSKYPETLAVGADGRPVQHGNRIHYCVNAGTYHRKTETIVSAMAARLERLPGIIGWQIDNEFSRVCYCDHCRVEFQEFLRRRFTSLDELNRHWSTAYWSQTYSDWRQIPLPIGMHNPGLMLEFKRFHTDSYRRFQKLQIDILRPHLDPRQFITHNYMGWFGGFDHYTLAGDLDMASWDFYVGSGHHDHLTSGAAHDLTRGFKQRNFWVMETQPGCVNWAGVNNWLNRGETRALAWHAVAHGADAVLYWQWRSAPGGQEQYHGSLIGADGKPRPILGEVAEIGKDFAAVEAAIKGTSPAAEAALINSYEARWSIEWQCHHKEFDYVKHLLHYYRPLARRNIPVDIIPADADLSRYRLVILPALAMITTECAAALDEFVHRGGHLAITIRCGLKDAYNALLPSCQPGPLAALAGVEAEEYFALDEPVPVEAPNGERLGESRLWAEALAPVAGGVEILARFGACNGWLDGRAAVTSRRVGAGAVHYIGAYLDAEAQDALLGRLLREAGLQPVLAAPKGVEAAARHGEGRDLYFLINHERSPRTVELPWRGRELLTGRAVAPGETLALKGYGVAVVEVSLTPAHDPSPQTSGEG